MSQTTEMTRGLVLLAFSIGTGTLVWFTTILRFWVLSHRKQRREGHDYVIAFAVISATIGTGFSIAEASAQLGSNALQFDILGQPWFMMGATLSKISICLVFSGLLGGAEEPRWRTTLCIFAFLLAVANVAFSLQIELQCLPLEKLWNSRVPGSCVSSQLSTGLGCIQGIVAFVSWFWLAAIPLMLSRPLNLRFVDKWPVYIFVPLSLLAGISATGRMIELARSQRGVYSNDTFAAMVLAVMEENFGIFAANALATGACLVDWAPEESDSRFSTKKTRSWPASSDASLVSIEDVPPFAPLSPPKVGAPLYWRPWPELGFGGPDVGIGGRKLSSDDMAEKNRASLGGNIAGTFGTTYV